MIPAKKLEPQVLVSWWIEAPRAGFTASVEQEQVSRMKASRFGQSGLAKVIQVGEGQ